MAILSAAVSFVLAVLGCVLFGASMYIRIEVFHQHDGCHFGGIRSGECTPDAQIGIQHNRIILRPEELVPLGLAISG